MQYRIGTVNVTNGSEIVEGIGTDFPANVHVGDHFKIAGENAIYNINAVNPGPGVQQITISPVYAGTTQVSAVYQIGRDRTPIMGLAEINAGDEDWPFWLTNEVIRKIDAAAGIHRLIDLADVHVGPLAPTDPGKIFWINTSGI